MPSAPLLGGHFAGGSEVCSPCASTATMDEVSSRRLPWRVFTTRDASLAGSSCGAMVTSRTRPQRLPVELYTSEPSSSESATTAMRNASFAEYESQCGLAILQLKKSRESCEPRGALLTSSRNRTRRATRSTKRKCGTGHGATLDTSKG